MVEVVDRATYGSDATQIVDYLYDVENRWIGELIDSDGNGEIDQLIGFAYDGDQIVLQFEKDVSESATGSASALGVADLSHRYTWLPNAVDQLMADEALSPLPQAGEGPGVRANSPLRRRVAQPGRGKSAEGV